MAQQSVVDRLYSEFAQLVEHLDATAEVSLRISAEEIFRKSLLLAAASYFEKRIQDDILEYIGKSLGEASLVTEFVKNKAIKRQYHTFFQWDSPNANVFFGLFGKEFKDYMTNYVRDHDDYKEAISAFLEIGKERNKIVHEDFGTFFLEKTTDEIFELYTKALQFVEQITSHFETFMESKGGDANSLT